MFMIEIVMWSYAIEQLVYMSTNTPGYYNVTYGTNLKDKRKFLMWNFNEILRDLATRKTYWVAYSEYLETGCDWYRGIAKWLRSE